LGKLETAKEKKNGVEGEKTPGREEKGRGCRIRNEKLKGEPKIENGSLICRGEKGKVSLVRREGLVARRGRTRLLRRIPLGA